MQKVKSEGDGAVIKLTNRFDRQKAKTISELIVSQDEILTAKSQISQEMFEALQAAADRIKSYHEHQKQASWQYKEIDGTVLGQRITPLDRVGIYVPGGKASYSSTVLMTGIPAKVAGVKEVIMAVPAPDSQLDPSVLVAADITGVS